MGNGQVTAQGERGSPGPLLSFHICVYCLVLQGACRAAAHGRHINNKVNFMMGEKVKQNKVKRGKKEGEGGRALECFLTEGWCAIPGSEGSLVTVYKVQKGKQNIPPRRAMITIPANHRRPGEVAREVQMPVAPTAALYTKAKCLSTDKWINKL